jgi:hypothetical protein
MSKLPIKHYGPSSGYNWNGYNPFSDKLPWEGKSEKKEKQRLLDQKRDRKKREAKKEVANGE